MSVTLILGGARSGKSGFAETRAKSSEQPVIYIATAEIRDDAIAERVSLHRKTRPSNWTSIESPLALGQSIRKYDSPTATLLVDCLTMWVTNVLCSENPTDLMHSEQREFFQSLAEHQGNVILVSNEVGMGIVPMGQLTRDYVDIAGRLHQDIAALADEVILVTAGLPLTLKHTS